MEEIQGVLKIENLTESIFNMLPVPILIFDNKYNLIFKNYSFEMFLGYPKNQLENKNWNEIINLISPGKMNNLNKIITEDKININLYVELNDNQGIRIPSIASVNPLSNNSGNTVGIMVFFEDLRGNINRKNIQQFSEYILNSIDTGIIAIDNNSKITIFNQAAEKMTGYISSESIGKDYSEIAEKISDQKKHLIETLFSGMGVKNIDFPSEKNKGQHLSINTGTVKDEMGFIKGAVSLIRDITEQENFFQLQQEVNFILDSINAGVQAINKNHEITTFNKMAENITGFKREMVIGHRVEDLAAYNKSYLYCLDTLKTGKEYNHFEFNYLDKNKQLKTISINTTQLRNDQGNVIGAVNVFFDVTHQKKIEENIQRAEKLAALGEMAAGTAHEIRNPLTSVKGFLQLMDSKYSDFEPEKKYIKIMIDEINNADEIIKDFLMFSKPQAPELINCQLNTIINNLLPSLKNEAAKTNINLNTLLCSDLPNVNVDPEQIKQVLKNLINNAFDALNPGGTLTISTLENSVESTVDIVIADTGTGITQDNINRIFNPFYSNPEFKGTGLGLTIAHQIIKQHNGQIQVESEVDKGTKFIVKLPVNLNVN